MAICSLFSCPILWKSRKNSLYLPYERKSYRPYQSDWETHQINWNAEISFVHQWRAAPSWLGGLQRGTGPQILLLGVSSSFTGTAFSIYIQYPLRFHLFFPRRKLQFVGFQFNRYFFIFKKFHIYEDNFEDYSLFILLFSLKCVSLPHLHAECPPIVEGAGWGHILKRAFTWRFGFDNPRISQILRN